MRSINQTVRYGQKRREGKQQEVPELLTLTVNALRVNSEHLELESGTKSQIDEGRVRATD